MLGLHRIRTDPVDVLLENASSPLDSIPLTFVMGCPRSGTTFLLRCLAGLPPLDSSRYDRYLWLWSECVTRCRDSGRVAGDRYLEIRYEELCAEPSRTGERLLRFLQVEGSRRFWSTLGSARSSSFGIGGGNTRGEAWEPIADLLVELGYQRG